MILAGCKEDLGTILEKARIAMPSHTNTMVKNSTAIMDWIGMITAQHR